MTLLDVCSKSELVAQTLVDDEDVEHILALGTLRLDGGGYVIINVPHPVIPGRYYTLGLHRFLLGVSYGTPGVVDHTNQNHLDNRKENLRLVNHSVNAHNSSRVSPFSFSQVRGVGFKKENAARGWACWYGRVKIRGTVYRTGYFHTVPEAKTALDNLQKEKEM